MFGSNLSPQLNIEAVPPSAKSLAIIIEDLDIDLNEYKDSPFTAQMMVWNIPPDTKRVTEGIRPPGTIGRNIKGNFAYDGPCPPKSETHRYKVTLYAVSKERLTVSSDAGLAEVKKALSKATISKQVTTVTAKGEDQ